MTPAEQAARPICKTCRFWMNQGRWNDGQDYGSCKRYPPSGHTDDEDGFGYWPWTFAADWCGEHNPLLPQGAEVPGDNLTAALVILARHGVPTDVLEMLVHGSPESKVQPGALAAAMLSAAPPAPAPAGEAQQAAERLVEAVEVVRTMNTNHASRAAIEVTLAEALLDWRAATEGRRG